RAQQDPYGRPAMNRCAVAVLLAASVAHAEPAKPWAAGVPEDVQTRAEKIFDDGNQLFENREVTAAIEKYREALALWDHPLIRFNLAAALIRTDHMLEASEELERALEYGAAPFSSKEYDTAMDDRRLLAGRVGEIEASC